jgi:uncharacterized membrane protein
MKTTSYMLASAVAAAVSLVALGGVAQAEDVKKEKCFGIAKASKNDCQTATHSCAGNSKVDADGESWLYVPAGTCLKITGGSLEPRKG